MLYSLLIYTDPADLPADFDPVATRDHWMSYTQELRESGAHRGGEALQFADTATTVRVRDGEVLNTDGPFAETKEILAGFYLIDVPDLDDALAWASRMPNITYGSVEVRPIMDVTGGA